MWCPTCCAGTAGPDRRSRGCKPRSVALATSPQCCQLRAVTTAQLHGEGTNGLTSAAKIRLPVLHHRPPREPGWKPMARTTWDAAAASGRATCPCAMARCRRTRPGAACVAARPHTSLSPSRSCGPRPALPVQRGCTRCGLSPALSPNSHRPLLGASWQVTMLGLCLWPMMLPMIYRSFYSSCKEAVNYRRGIN